MDIGVRVSRSRAPLAVLAGKGLQPLRHLLLSEAETPGVLDPSRSASLWMSSTLAAMAERATGSRRRVQSIWTGVVLLLCCCGGAGSGVFVYFKAQRDEPGIRAA